MLPLGILVNLMAAAQCMPLMLDLVLRVTRVRQREIYQPCGACGWGIIMHTRARELVLLVVVSGKFSETGIPPFGPGFASVASLLAYHASISYAVYQLNCYLGPGVSMRWLT